MVIDQLPLLSLTKSSLVIRVRTPPNVGVREVSVPHWIGGPPPTAHKRENLRNPGPAKPLGAGSLLPFGSKTCRPAPRKPPLKATCPDASIRMVCPAGRKTDVDTGAPVTL